MPTSALRMTSVASPWFWIAFIGFLLVMLAVDLGVFHRKSHEVSFREALMWTGIWAALSLSFSLFVAKNFGAVLAGEYLSGYLLEQALSVDNMFVFVLIFAGFAVPRVVQHRVLFWGILGAIIFRGVFILLGAAVLQRFHWVLYLFGVVLLYTGGKLMFSGEDDDEEKDINDNAIVKFARRLVPITPSYRGESFFVVEDGRRMATPLFLVLLTVEISDIVFAVDSVPAVFAVTRDPFIVFTSNMFAIMGLRSVYFVLSSILPLFRFLRYGIAVVLLFVAVKILLPGVETLAKLPEGTLHLSTWSSLIAIVVCLGGSILLSVLVPRKRR